MSCSFRFISSEIKPTASLIGVIMKQGLYEYRGPKHKFLKNGKRYEISPNPDMLFMCDVKGSPYLISTWALAENFKHITDIQLFNEKLREELNE